VAQERNQLSRSGIRSDLVDQVRRREFIGRLREWGKGHVGERQCSRVGPINQLTNRARSGTWQLYISPMLSSTGNLNGSFAGPSEPPRLRQRSLSVARKISGATSPSSLRHAWPLRQRLSNSWAIATTWRSWKSSGLVWRKRQNRQRSVREFVR
jgi:hypothetical protein